MELYDLTIHELHDKILSREISAMEITESLLARIDEIEDSVGSYITICKDEAIKRAKEVQREIQSKFQSKTQKGEVTSDSALIGIPMALKDNISTKGIRTTCASKMLENYVPQYDATVAKKMHSCKSILLGKLNMDEFAMGSSTETSYFKITRNPWDLSRVPGGSSGGSAAAVASGEAVFTLGSDTGGSVRQPAAFCGVVGMKPSYGFISRNGLVAFASSIDHIGSITKDVEDCAILLNVLSGHDKYDETSVNIRHPDYTKSLVNNVKGLKIGMPEEFMSKEINVEVRSAVLHSIEILEDLGAEVEEFSLPMADYVLPVYYLISSAEASSSLSRYDGVKYGFRAEDYTDLNDMYIKTRSEGFGYEVKKRIILGTLALSGEHYVKHYEKALKLRNIITNDLYRSFDIYDIIISPTTFDTAFKIGNKDKIDSKDTEVSNCNYFTAVANLAGIPGISIPCGLNKDGLPIGLQMMAARFNEATLIRSAYTFEQNTMYNRLKMLTYNRKQ